MSHDSAVLDRFRTSFNVTEPGAAPDLSALYSSDIRFQDPFVEIQGFEELDEYLSNAYQNVRYCRFEFGESFGDNGQHALPWIMSLKHRKLAGGELVRVQGLSHVSIRGDRICFHRDYFDAGQLLYENIPVLGAAVRFLRRHAA